MPSSHQPPASRIELLTLRANAPQFDTAQGEKGLPQRILVLAWGDHDTTKGKVICDATTMQQLAAYNATQNWDRIALDFEHNSVPGSPSYQGEPVKIAGYGTLQLVAGEGIYLLMSSWTPQGKEYAAGGHYGDLSPVVKVNERNEVIGLHSVALCRHGATPGLVFLSAAAPVQHPASSIQDQASSIQHPASKSMTPEQLVAELAKILGLAADAPPADILAALTTKMGDSEKELTAMKAKSKEDAKTLSAATKGDDTLKLLSTQLKDQGDQLKDQGGQLKDQGDQLKALSNQLLDSQRGEIIAAAVREGKQVPSIANTLALSELKKLTAELPVTVPMEKRLSSAPPASGAVDTAETAAVSSMTGVSAEDRAKYAKR
jgi:phage I-like protein